MQRQGKLAPDMSIALFAEIIGIVVGLTIVAIGVTVDSMTVISIGCLALALAGGYRLWLCLSQRERYFSYCDMHIAGLAVAYFGGAAVTMGLSFGGALEYWSAPDAAIFLVATIYTVVFYVCARFCGVIERRFWRPVWHREARQESWGPFLIGALGVVGLLQIYMLYTGGITYSGTGFVEGAKIPYLPSAVIALSWPIPGICGWVLGRPALRQSPSLLLTTLAVLVIQIPYAVTFGRRAVLFTLIIFLTMFLWARGRGFRARSVAVVALCALPLVYVLWLFFHTLRIDSAADYRYVGETFRPYETRTIFERLGTTGDALRSNWRELEASQVSSVIDRVFVIGFLTDLINGTKVSSPFYGTEALHQTVTAIPRMMLPGKHELLAELKADEEQIDIRFGLPPYDRASTIVTSAYVNALWLGPFFFAPLMLLVGALLARISLIGGSGFYRVLAVSYVLYLGLSIEEAFITGTLNAIRVLLVIAIPFAAAKLLRAPALPAFFSRS